VLERDKPEGVKRLILTASGGPFREATQKRLESVKREDALAHPVWDMGAKISIDSATLMNKGLELIEASYFTKINSLTFFEPDLVKFPALRLAREALKAGGKAPCVLNAANEIAVKAFLEEKIS